MSKELKKFYGVVAGTSNHNYCSDSCRHAFIIDVDSSREDLENRWPIRAVRDWHAMATDDLDDDHTDERIVVELSKDLYDAFESCENFYDTEKLNSLLDFYFDGSTLEFPEGSLEEWLEYRSQQARDSSQTQGLS